MIKNDVDTVALRVGWGKYDQWEGPWFQGKQPYELPAAPDFFDRVMATITATEGGKYDAINMYDRCKVTVGVIQWGEVCANGAVTRMLGLCADHDLMLVRGYLAEAGLSIDRVGGEWRIMYGGVAVRGESVQNLAFFGGSDGRVGHWTQDQKAHAKRVAAALAAMWTVPAFRDAQMQFTKPKLIDFAAPFGAGPSALFARGFPTDGWGGAMRAGYLSFAANLPAVAARRVTPIILGLSKTDPRAACHALLKDLTFGPGVAIYPERYNKIRPVLETLFGVDLPDVYRELKAWENAAGEPAKLFPTLQAIQAELIVLGYDLGPWGADGRPGAKTTAAVKAFQRAHGLDADGVVGKLTLAALATAREERLRGPHAIDEEAPDTKRQTPTSKSQEMAAVRPEDKS